MHPCDALAAETDTSSLFVQPLLHVPESACLIVDYERGMQLPAQAWPRLHKGLQREEALPWDILLVCLRPQLTAPVCRIEYERHSTLSMASSRARSSSLLTCQLSELTHGHL